MTGTEKQVAWATKIKAERLAALRQKMDDVRMDEKDGYATPGEVAMAAAMAAAVPALEKVESAAFWIETKALRLDDLCNAAAGKFPPTSAYPANSDYDGLLRTAAESLGTTAQWAAR